VLGVIVINKKKLDGSSLTIRLYVLSIGLTVCYVLAVYFKFKLGFTANNLPLDVIDYQREFFVRNGVLLTDVLLLIPFVFGGICSIYLYYLRANIKESMKWFIIGFALHFAVFYFCRNIKDQRK
jgi:hypothetical protein